MDGSFGATISNLLVAGQNPLQILWTQFAQYIPQLLAAIVILLAGWGVGALLGNLTSRVVQYTGVDNWVNRSGLNETLKLGDGSRYALLSGIIGSLVKWLIILAAAGAAADAANMPNIAQFVGTIFGYIPNVIVAIVILVVGFIGAALAADFATAGAALSRFSISSRGTIASVVKYAIVTLAIMAALIQLRIVPSLIEILFGGLVLALALAFGLGGRDHASDAIKRLREQA
jgi:hypothetical protein